MTKYAPTPLWKIKKPWKELTVNHWSDYERASWRPVSIDHVEVCVTLKIKNDAPPDVLVHQLLNFCRSDWGFHVNTKDHPYWSVDSVPTIWEHVEYVFTIRVYSTPPYP